MGFLDRLDAIDDRLGLGPASKRPPRRLTRWTAGHPWLFTLAWVALMAGLELVTKGVGAGLGITVAGYLVLGYLVALSVQNRVRIWDARQGPAGEAGGP